MPSCKPWGWQTSLAQFDNSNNSNVTIPFRFRLSPRTPRLPRYNQLSILRGARWRPSRTEQRNPRSRGLDRKSTLEILRILNREDARVAAAVRRELPNIARAVDASVKSLRKGGRLFYVGAGTSGRLAVLDAAECPPTFGTPAKMVQARSEE